MRSYKEDGVENKEKSEVGERVDIRDTVPVIIMTHNEFVVEKIFMEEIGDRREGCGGVQGTVDMSTEST